MLILSIIEKRQKSALRFQNSQNSLRIQNREKGQIFTISLQNPYFLRQIIYDFHQILVAQNSRNSPEFPQNSQNSLRIVLRILVTY